MLIDEWLIKRKQTNADGTCLRAQLHTASTSRHWTQREPHTASALSAGRLGRRLPPAPWQGRPSAGTGAAAANQRHDEIITLISSHRLTWGQGLLCVIRVTNHWGLQEYMTSNQVYKQGCHSATFLPAHSRCVLSKARRACQRMRGLTTRGLRPGRSRCSCPTTARSCPKLKPPSSKFCPNSAALAPSTTQP